MSAVLVTRGDVDLAPVLDSLRPVFDDIVVWNNAERDDLHVYGRYAAIDEAKHPFIYTQDDDAICPAAEICAHPCDGLLVNVPPGEQPWLAWGAVFPRGLAHWAFHRYAEHYGGIDTLSDDALEFRRWSDVVFAHVAGWTSVDLGHEDLPWATAPNRMYHQPDHYTGQQRIRERCEALI